MSDPLKILIVDDEAPARSRMTRLLKKDSRAGELFEADGGPAAVEAISAGGIDLVLLDIQMPGMTGFEVIEAVGPEAMPPVVFVTAYDQHALSAFEVQALDYLLKPVRAERMSVALDRAVSARADASGLQAKLTALVSELGSRDRWLRRLVVPVRGRLVVIPVEKILFFQAAGNYVEIHTSEKAHLWRGTLAALEDRLDPARFARIHRSTIVNLNAVRELEPWSHGDYDVTMSNGHHLRLSRRFRDRLLTEE